ncbi:unnamed protein product [Parnassius mnemosyne]|uniref:Uncharacterized protein n=1 Tax=Parnassius mnemosyne TaxID=213953 RepID=A0AAV1LP68_9NEOP
MGCVASIKRVHVLNPTTGTYFDGCPERNNETVLAALVRIDEEIFSSEKSYPVERLAVVSAETDIIQEEINIFAETTRIKKRGVDSYGKTLHEMFVSLDLYRRPILAIENEDFVANVNRKEMRQIELNWLHTRHEDLQNEKRILHARILRIRSLNGVMQQLLDNISSDRPDTPLEEALKRARALCHALASVSVRLQAAVNYAHAAARTMDEALPSWKLLSLGKNGWERTAACADACRLLVRARCLERAARRVLSASAAPRAARSLRLALDYAFTDALHDHKYQKATETLVQFKEALSLLINCIHQVLLNNMDHLAAAEKDVQIKRKNLRMARVDEIVKKGLADLTFDLKLLKSLHTKK